MNPLRFSSVIPIAHVYNDTANRRLNPADRHDRMLEMEAVFQLDSLVRGDFPYGYDHNPSPDEPLDTVIRYGQGVRTRILQRLRLLDPDFANDPHQRAVTLSGEGQHFLLTGDDAQPTQDADELDDAIHLDDDPVVLGLETELSEVDQDAIERIRKRIDDTYRAERQRAAETAQNAARQLQITITAPDDVNIIREQYEADMQGRVILLIHDIASC